VSLSLLWLRDRETRAREREEAAIQIAIEHREADKRQKAELLAGSADLGELGIEQQPLEQVDQVLQGLDIQGSEGYDQIPGFV
jgi:hypothetical protein